MKIDLAHLERMKGGIFSFLMRLSGDYELSRDILQETFLRYLERYDGKDTQPSLLFTIARNAFIDHVRKSGRELPLVDDHRDCAPDAHERFRVRQEYSRVLEAIESLGQDEREILSMALSGDLSYRQIADIVGTSEANVKVKVHRARCRIREILKGGDHER
ncbi:MAG TPA: RNA polymerase sigma factor [Deltaproteobacteria bacterium]|nr:RNA polymerase sigma factor [Deltaproteobacteria bacterium]HOM28372.1 RNA polymerase sigma factor [Deltaproteobacteria bacterium]HPP81693.1 RNA polymerase sigma factor [Deltaproteobacteria bacterium]